MATQPTATWRFRVGGNAANGAGYDPGISGAGTDYSQADAPALSLADIACAGTTTVTSATGGFTAAMIGNALRITGGGASTGYYWITARASSTSITVDRSPGTVSGGAGRVGGACTGDPGNLAAHVVAGNVVYLRASAGNAASYPTTGLDYAMGSYAAPTSGSSSAGYVRWVGENGMPTIGVPGLAFYNVTLNSFENLYFCATGGDLGGYGLINSADSARARGCTINLNSQAGLIGVGGSSFEAEGNDIYGGSTSPTSSAGSTGIVTGNYCCQVRNNRIHHCRDRGIDDAGAGSTIVGNRIWGCAGDGIRGSAVATGFPGTIAGNTVHGNAGHGIAVTGTGGIAAYHLLNNVITGHLGAGKVGLIVSDGTTAVNDRRRRFADYNNLHNNATNYSGISAGAHDLAVDPGYADAANGDFTPSNAAMQAGY